MSSSIPTTVSRRYQTLCQHLQPAQVSSRSIESSPCSGSSQTSNSILPTSSAKFPYHLPSHTRFGDCDLYGHVNNVTYYSYFDTVVNTYLIEAAGLDTANSEVIGIVVASNCTYKSSLNFPQKMTLGLRVVKLGSTSVTYEIGVFKHDAPTFSSEAILCAFGSFTHVFVTKKTMKPVEIPEKFRHALKAIQTTSTASTSPRVSSPVSSSSSQRKQSTSSILMVRPRHFQRNEETAEDNGFMSATTLSAYEINKRANAEFDAYVELLRSKGVKVTVFNPSEGAVAPDGVYPNNWISTHPMDGCNPSKVVLYSMKHPSRRIERDPSLIASLRTNYDTLYDFTTAEESNSIFEGTGSGIIDHINRILYYSHSERSNGKLAIEVAAKALWPNQPHRVIGFHAVDSKGHPYYHTNVHMSLGTHWALLCPESMPNKAEVDEVMTALNSTGHELICITRAQVDQLCGNVLEIQNQQGETLVVMSERAYQAFTPEQKAVFLKYAKELIHTPLDTIETIGGGGARCMIAELF